MCLEDGRTLSDYNIQEEATIYLPGQIGAAFPIQIKFPTGETIRILIEGINTIGDLKSRLQVETWVPRGKGAEFRFKKMETTIADSFFHPDIQKLIIDGQQLEDEKLIFDYNIKRQSTVDLQLPFHLNAPLSKWIAGSINITIQPLKGETFLIRAKGTDTIDNVKSRIQNEKAIASGEHSKPEFKNKILTRFLLFDWQINSDCFSLESNWRMGGQFRNTRFRKM